MDAFRTTIKRKLARQITHTGELGDRILASLWLGASKVDIREGELDPTSKHIAVSTMLLTASDVHSHEQCREMSTPIMLDVHPAAQPGARNVVLRSLTKDEGALVDAWVDQVVSIGGLPTRSMHMRLSPRVEQNSGFAGLLIQWLDTAESGETVTIELADIPNEQPTHLADGIVSDMTIAAVKLADDGNESELP